MVKQTPSKRTTVKRPPVKKTPIKRTTAKRMSVNRYLVLVLLTITSFFVVIVIGLLIWLAILHHRTTVQAAQAKTHITQAVDNLPPLQGCDKKWSLYDKGSGGINPNWNLLYTCNSHTGIIHDAVVKGMSQQGYKLLEDRTLTLSAGSTEYVLNFQRQQINVAYGFVVKDGQPVAQKMAAAPDAMITTTYLHVYTAPY